MIKNGWGVLGFAGVALLVSTGAVAGGSGGGPGPFGPRPSGSYNSHFELADGESYFLPGKVVFDFKGAPYFEVDLVAASWLASEARKAVPYYALEGTAEFWRKYENKSVRMLCVAHGKIVIAGASSQYVITLELAQNHPVLIR